MIRTSNMNTENNIAIVCITDNGKNLAVKIQKKLKEGKIYFVKKKNNEESQEVCNICNDTYTMKNDKLELRQQNSVNSRIRAAKFPYLKHLEELDINALPLEA